MQHWMLSEGGERKGGVLRSLGCYPTNLDYRRIERPASVNLTIQTLNATQYSDQYSHLLVVPLDICTLDSRRSSAVYATQGTRHHDE